MSNELQKLSPWLDRLSFQWDYLKEYGKPVELKKDDNLFHNGDELNSIFIVESGRIRLYLITMGGKEKTINIIGQNGIIGDHFLSDTKTHITSAVAVSDSKLIEINKTTFEKLTLDNPDFTKQWIKMLSMKLELLTTSSVQLTFESSIQRLVNVIVQLSEVYGVKNNDGSVKISITFTHQELADLIGTTRVTVSNSIKKLYDSKLIYKKSGHYFITDLNKLRNLLEEFELQNG